MEQRLVYSGCPPSSSHFSSPTSLLQAWEQSLPCGLLLLPSPEPCPSSQTLSFRLPCSWLPEALSTTQIWTFCAWLSPPYPQEAVPASHPGTSRHPGISRTGGLPSSAPFLCLQHRMAAAPLDPHLGVPFSTLHPWGCPSNSSSLAAKPSQTRHLQLLWVLGPTREIPLCLLLLTVSPPCPHHGSTRTVSPGEFNLHPATGLRSHLSWCTGQAHTRHSWRQIYCSTGREQGPVWPAPVCEGGGGSRGGEGGGARGTPGSGQESGSG